jgi:hypothetical protein
MGQHLPTPNANASAEKICVNTLLCRVSAGRGSVADVGEAGDVGEAPAKPRRPKIGDVICVCLVARYREASLVWETPMRFRQIVVSTAFAAGLAAVPVATAKAQYYYPACSPFPLFWPFCVAGAIVGTAATIVAAPFVALTAPPYYYGYYGRPYYTPPPYYPPRYSPPYNYGPR